jgi:hypothetical protein
VILVDTSVWVDHLRFGVPDLTVLLEGGRALMHPFLIGELACGNPRAAGAPAGARLRAASRAVPVRPLFDLEGDPFFGTGGLEYLWGWSDAEGDYEHLWALDRRAEREAFGEFMAMVLAHWREHPEMHVFQYGPYEPSALKRLMSIHGDFMEELDTMLRAGLFVDLLTVTRQAARIGMERYSLKDLERLHGYERYADLRGVGPHKRALEHGLMLGEVEAVPEESHEVVRVYNRDDVRSTVALREWLEARRSDLAALGLEPERPGQGDGAPGETLQEKRTAAMETVEALRSGLRNNEEEWNDAERATALLANLIDFERREDKAVFWEKFVLQAMEPEALEAASKGVSGLAFVEELPGGTPGRPVHRYRFRPQELDVRSGDGLYAWQLPRGTSCSWATLSSSSNHSRPPIPTAPTLPCCAT